MNPQTENWLASSEYDLETAEPLLKSGRYLYVVFMCHLSIEKALKAIVSEATQAMPPRIHDLKRLSELALISPEAKLEQFMDRLSSASVPTRYPDDLKKTLSQYTEGEARTCIDSTKEVLAWLRSDPRLQPPSTATPSN